MRNAFQPGCFSFAQNDKTNRVRFIILGEAYRSKTFSPQM